MKRILIFAVFGALLGAVSSSWIGPKVIGWWFQPPVNVPVDCTNALQSNALGAMERLIKVQVIGLCSGLVAGLIASFIFRNRRSISPATNPSVEHLNPPPTS